MPCAQETQAYDFENDLGSNAVLNRRYTKWKHKSKQQ